MSTTKYCGIIVGSYRLLFLGFGRFELFLFSQPVWEIGAEVLRAFAVQRPHHLSRPSPSSLAQGTLCPNRTVRPNFSPG